MKKLMEIQLTKIDGELLKELTFRRLYNMRQYRIIEIVSLIDRLILLNGK